MNLSAADLALLVDELHPAWQGAQIQKIHMRGARTVTLTLRQPGRTGAPQTGQLAGATMRRASGRCSTKRTAASWPSSTARRSSSTWRAPRAVTASGKSASPSSTSVTLLASTQSFRGGSPPGPSSSSTKSSRDDP